MARNAGVPDRSTLRFSPYQVRLARQYEESNQGPLWGELNVLLHGSPWPPARERWRRIRACETEQYWVSDLGNLAVWRERPARVWERNGYAQAVIYVDGRKRPRAIHRLVAGQFCSGNLEGCLVRHRNSNTRENYANNLVPGVPLDNARDRQDRVAGIVPNVSPPAREIWRLSDEYAGVRVSNHGRVNLSWWVAFNTAGYWYKSGKRQGSRKHVSAKIVLGDTSSFELLHRLVYEAFRGPIPPDMIVRHRNDNPHDNRLDNLDAGSAAENVKDRIRNGHQRYGEDHPNAKYVDSQRAEFLQLVDGGLSIREAADRAGIKVYSGYQILWRRRKGLPIMADGE
jgi:hypothetical protein